MKKGEFSREEREYSDLHLNLQQIFSSNKSSATEYLRLEVLKNGLVKSLTCKILFSKYLDSFALVGMDHIGVRMDGSLLLETTALS